MNNQYEALSYERKRLQKEELAPEWYSTASYQLLRNKHYLDVGETPRDMYKRIASRAAELTEAPPPVEYGYTSWKEAFFDIMWKGWLSPSTPVLTNMGNERGHPISCLTGKSWLNTDHEGGTYIKDIKVGDKVLTHKGRFMPVTNVQSRMSTDDLYELKVSTRTTPISITGNHPVKTNKGWVQVKDLNPSVHLIATNDIINYSPKVHIIDMKKYVTYPMVLKDGLIYRKQVDKSGKPSRQNVDNISNQSAPIKEFVEVTDDLSWAFGLWLAEGSDMRDANKNSSGIRITMSIKEQHHVNKFLDIIKDSFGITGGTSEGRKTKHCEATWFNGVVSNKVIGSFFREEFGVGAKYKNTPYWLKQLPVSSIEKVINGVYIGDGKKTTRNSTYITLSNPKLVMSLYEIGLKAGLKVGLQMQEKAGKNATVANTQRLNLYNYKLGTSPNSIHSVPFEDGLRYCPFKIAKLHHNELVYDITVEEDHSFTTAGVVVHNCSGTYVGDSIRSFEVALTELAQLTQRGYGCSAGLDAIRQRGAPISKGGTANGPWDFAEDVVHKMAKISQGNTRRGSAGQYISIMSPDVDEFMDQIIADDDGWNIGWIVEDDYNELFKRAPEEADRLWQKSLKTKATKGKGYYLFTSKINRNRPQVYVDRGMYVKFSNLCSEIMLFADENHSFTCVLSSMNVSKYDEWKDTATIQIAMVFLDAVISDMLIKAKQEEGFERVVAFTEKSRAVGLGVLGLSTYYQQNSWVFGGVESLLFNKIFFKDMATKALEASRYLAKHVGEPAWLKGYGERFTHTIALPPTKSTANIMGGTSEGINPVFSNVYEQDTAGGTVYRINPTLLSIMKERGQYTEEVMKRVSEAQGSVQGEDWLSDHEKDVFRTAFEINQKTVLKMASDRQKIMGPRAQGQSINLYFPMETTEEEIAEVHHYAFKDEHIHSLYYMYVLNKESTYKVDTTSCTACEG